MESYNSLSSSLLSLFHLQNAAVCFSGFSCEFCYIVALCHNNSIASQQQTHRTIKSSGSSSNYLHMNTIAMTTWHLFFVLNQLIIMLNFTGEGFIVQFPTVSPCGVAWLETWLVMERWGGYMEYVGSRGYSARKLLQIHRQRASSLLWEEACDCWSYAWSSL